MVNRSGIFKSQCDQCFVICRTDPFKHAAIFPASAMGLTATTSERTPFGWSLPKQRFIQSAQGDDGFECAHRNLAPVGNGNRGAVPGRQLPPVDEMAASLVHEREAVLAQEPAHFGGGQWPKLRHESIREAGRCRPPSADA